MHTKRTLRQGFTIVELLIVVVVIGILAAITIVAYNGIQTRARNAQQLSAAKSYLTIFASYVAANGAYPPTVYNRICLGIDQAACVNNTSWHRDGTLETNLKTIASSLPTGSASSPISGSPKIGYIPISDVTLDGVNNPFLLYTVEPPATCTVGTPVSGTWPNYSSTPASQGYTASEPNLRHCGIALPRI